VNDLKFPALDPATVPVKIGSDHPAPFTLTGRAKQALGNALGLTNFGVNLVRLPPGAPSTQRHWHTRQDEFVYVLVGEIVLVNRGARDAVYLEVGDRTPGDEIDYPDIDLARRQVDGEERYVHKDGTPYPREDD